MRPGPPGWPAAETPQSPAQRPAFGGRKSCFPRELDQTKPRIDHIIGCHWPLVVERSVRGRCQPNGRKQPATANEFSPVPAHFAPPHTQVFALSSRSKSSAAPSVFFECDPIHEYLRVNPQACIAVHPGYARQAVTIPRWMSAGWRRSSGRASPIASTGTATSISVIGTCRPRAVSRLIFSGNRRDIGPHMRDVHLQPHAINRNAALPEIANHGIDRVRFGIRGLGFRVVIKEQCLRIGLMSRAEAAFDIGRSRFPLGQFPADRARSRCAVLPAAVRRRPR